MEDVLVISGPAGVGKSSVAFEVSRQLQLAGTAHALIDTDELDHIYPVPDDLPAITERNLAAIWGSFTERGTRRLILVGVYLDRPSELEWIARAVPHARFTLVRLTSSEDTLFERVRLREIGTGMRDQWERTMRQVSSTSDGTRADLHQVHTDGAPVVEIAQRVLALWPADP